MGVEAATNIEKLLKKGNSVLYLVPKSVRSMVVCDTCLVPICPDSERPADTSIIELAIYAHVLCSLEHGEHVIQRIILRSGQIIPYLPGERMEYIQ